MIHILSMTCNNTKGSVNVNCGYCCLNTKGDTENIWGDILKDSCTGLNYPEGLHGGIGNILCLVIIEWTLQ